MDNGFFAMISRMKYINRWALMRNEHSENLAEHSFEVAVIAHALTIIGNRRLGKSLDSERAAFLGLYHDAPETLTGDMPTPVKYYSSEVRSAYKTMEDAASATLLKMIPDDMKADFEGVFTPDEKDAELLKYIKAADKISALIKCMQEGQAGNTEFVNAAESTQKAIANLGLPEADIFVSEFLPAYKLTLDELKSE